MPSFRLRSQQYPKKAQISPSGCEWEKNGANLFWDWYLEWYLWIALLLWSNKSYKIINSTWNHLGEAYADQSYESQLNLTLKGSKRNRVSKKLLILPKLK